MLLQKIDFYIYQGFYDYQFFIVHCCNLHVLYNNHNNVMFKVKVKWFKLKTYSEIVYNILNSLGFVIYNSNIYFLF